MYLQSVFCLILRYHFLLSSLTLHFYKHTLLTDIGTSRILPDQEKSPRTPKCKVSPTGSQAVPMPFLQMQMGWTTLTNSHKAGDADRGKSAALWLMWSTASEGTVPLKEERSRVPVSIFPYPDRRTTDHPPCYSLSLPPGFPVTTAFLGMLGSLSFNSISDFCSWQGLFLPTPTVILAVFFKYGYPPGYGG